MFMRILIAVCVVSCMMALIPASHAGIYSTMDAEVETDSRNPNFDVFQKVLQQNPRYPEVNFYLGHSYFGLNQFERALDCFDKELKVDPEYRRAHFSNTSCYLRLVRHL